MSLATSRRADVRDAALGVAVAALLVATTLVAPPTTRALDPAAYVLLTVSALSLVARRRAPVTVLAVTTACVVVYQVADYPGLVTALPALVAAFTAVRAGRRWPAVAAGGVLVGGVLVAHLALVDTLPIEVVVERRVLLAGWLVAAGVAGEVSRKHHAYVAEVERRAAEAEHARDQVARRRASEERLAIARELHDSLTHNISVIKVQAGVAVHLARKRGVEVPAALLAIQEASGEAARDLRATLDALRTADAATDGTGTGDGTSSGNGLARLPDLVARARAAGLHTTMTVTGEERPLPAAVERAAYRIVQEAVTNVARHAGPASAAVRLRYHRDGLTVQVDDDSRARPSVPPRPGMGLTGMRERVEALGGRLRAEPRPEGGFTVQAELPVEVAS